MYDCVIVFVMVLVDDYEIVVNCWCVMEVVVLLVCYLEFGGVYEIDVFGLVFD